MSQQLFLYLDSTKDNTNVFVNNNQPIHQIVLLNSYLQTTSSSRGIYFVSIDDLYGDNITNNISNRSRLIPIPYGSTSWSLILHGNGPIKQNYTYRIYDESGNVTTDSVKVVLYFNLN